MPLSQKGQEVDCGVLDFPYEISSSLIDDDCRDCILRENCATCYGINYSRSGNIFKKDTSACRLIKLTFWAASTLAYRMYESGDMTVDDDNKYYFFNGIKKIQSMTIQ